MATLTVQTPDRSIEQRMEALRRANAVRSWRAMLKVELKEGRPVLGLLTEPPDHALTMKVGDLLLALPKYGRWKVTQTLREVGIAWSRTVGGLTARQRAELVSLLRERGVR